MKRESTDGRRYKMSYTWTNGELITAEKLNETGGSGGGSNVVVLNGEKDSANPSTNLVFDKTLAEITELFESGATLVCKVPIATQSTPGGTQDIYLYLPMTSYVTYNGEIGSFQFYGFAEMYLYYVIIGQTGSTYYEHHFLGNA